MLLIYFFHFPFSFALIYISSKLKIDWKNIILKNLGQQFSVRHKQTNKWLSLTVSKKKQQTAEKRSQTFS